MYDAGKIIVGLVIFVGLMTYPFWSSPGRPTPLPQVELTAEAKAAKECVEGTEFMRSTHMQLLNEWRDQTVREGMRIYTGSGGRQYAVSLSNTCMQCHYNKENFCDRCHNYASVRPYCWDCHFVPERKTDG